MGHAPVHDHAPRNGGVRLSLRRNGPMHTKRNQSAKPTDTPMRRRPRGGDATRVPRAHYIGTTGYWSLCHTQRQAPATSFLNHARVPRAHVPAERRIRRVRGRNGEWRRRHACHHLARALHRRKKRTPRRHAASGSAWTELLSLWLTARGRCVAHRGTHRSGSQLVSTPETGMRTASPSGELFSRGVERTLRHDAARPPRPNSTCGAPHCHCLPRGRNRAMAHAAP